VAALDVGRLQIAVPRPPDAAHLEHVAEVGGEFEHQRQHHLVEAEVCAADPLIEALVLQRAPALDVNRAARRAAAVDRRQRPVGAVEGEDRIVVGDGAGEPGRAPLADAENPPRQHAGVAVVETFCPAGDIAVLVGDQEGVAILQRDKFDAAGDR
jgi:hypothetical protein